MGHKWVPHIWRTLHTFNGTKHNNLLVFRIPRSINKTHMSASYMENITLLQWDKNNNFLYGEFHVPSMGHKWVYRVRRISRPFNGTHSSASFMEKATLLEWDKIGCIVYGEWSASFLCLENVMRIQWDANEYLVYRTYHSPSIGQTPVGFIWWMQRSCN